ncbi:DUF3053 family protein [Clostridium cibarium]|uniref:DUF3053 family protein n=1 Tax=Clostridium cibarium TaxID=2762247 RepID=A0ABR8PYM1_9CLOT|nr:DUF3053 family protein [Clostridium cibarium]MBD7913260.1 DUF3053 family protein [Clostridium cibarium]
MSNFTNYNNNNNNNFYGNQNYGFQPYETKNKKGVLFILSIVFFALGFLISCLNTFVNHLRNTRLNLPNTMSFSLGLIFGSIVIIAILFLLGTKVFKKNGVLFAFSIIFFLGSLGSTVTTVKAIGDEARANRAGEEKLISVCNSIANEQDISGENYEKSQYGELTPILNIIRDYGTKCTAFKNDINNNISSIGLETMLNPNSLGDVEKIKSSKKKLEDTVKIYDDYETKYNDLVTNLDTSVSNTELPKEFKTSFLDGFRKSQLENSKDMKEFFKVEKDVFSKINSLMDFLLASQGKYVVKNNEILFYADADLDKYNGFIKDINNLAQKEAEIQNRIAKSKSQKLDDLNNLK